MGLVSVIGLVWWSVSSGVFSSSKDAVEAAVVDIAAPWRMRRADTPVVFVPIKEKRGGGGGIRRM